MSDFSERDKTLLAKFGMTEEQVERDEEMISVSIRVPKSTS